MILVFMLVVSLASIVLGELNYAVLGTFAECVERFAPVPYDFMVTRYGNLEISPTNRSVLERRSLDQVLLCCMMCSQVESIVVIASEFDGDDYRSMNPLPLRKAYMEDSIAEGLFYDILISGLNMTG